MDLFSLALGALLKAVGGTRAVGAGADTDVLLVGTGRRAPTGAERAELGELEIPFVLG
ncbi:hypothetical protein [Lentzea kristufekii]|uniref:hypothetical protein n=1 Tax=Lentzea kristufekii TaxID=3095430 RepID=UPI0038733F7C